MISRNVISLLSLVCISTSLSVSQPTFNSISASLGVIRTTHTDQETGALYAFYPELQAGGELFSPAVRWAGYWGYWTDGITEPRPFADFVTYSVRAHILGARVVYFQPGSSPLPVGIFAGFADHFATAHYVGGSGLDGQPGKDFSQGTNTVELGLVAEVAIAGSLTLNGKVEELLLLGSPGNELSLPSRQAYQIGMGMKF